MTLELKLSFVRDNPPETKTKDIDKNLWMEIDEFQVDMDAAKLPVPLKSCILH